MKNWHQTWMRIEDGSGLIVELKPKSRKKGKTESQDPPRRIIDLSTARGRRRRRRRNGAGRVGLLSLQVWPGSMKAVVGRPVGVLLLLCCFIALPQKKKEKKEKRRKRRGEVCRCRSRLLNNVVCARRNDISTRNEISSFVVLMLST